MTDIKAAMKRRGLSNSQLAAKVGIPSATLASYKSGARNLGAGTAERLAAHLGTSGPELEAENKVAGLKRAAESGDRAEVMKAARRVVKFAEASGADRFIDEDLDELVSAVVKYAGNVVPYSDEDDSDPYGYALEGRDRQGRRIRGRESAADDFEDDLEDEDEDDEDGYDLDDEGRDSRGIRVRPMRATTGGF